MKGIKIDFKNSFRNKRPYFILFIILLTVLSTAIYLWGDFKNNRSGLNMSHRSKIEDMGLDCTDCHTVKEDNPRFMTFPDHETCSMCHFDAVDETSADKDCSLCHNKPGNKVNTRKDMILSPLVIFDHDNHRKNGEVACLECHDKILTEYDVEDPEAALPNMGTCIVCHKERGVGKVSDCMSCHVKDWEKIRPMSHDASWESVHGKDLSKDRIDSNCTSCHKEEFDNSCTDCHHEKEMRIGKTDYCGSCHASGFDTTRPKDHTPFWSSKHGRNLTRTEIDETCDMCHTIANNNDCQSCHKREAPKSHTTAWRIRSHGNRARINRETCSTCHTQSECISCHTTSEPTSHTGLWGSSYNRHCYNCHADGGNYVSDTSIGSNCTFCHRASEVVVKHRSNQYPGHQVGNDCTACHSFSVGLGTKIPHPYVPDKNSCVSCHQ